MNDVILLVEDNPDEQALAIMALQKSNITNRIVVAHDGVEALEFLFGTNGRERVVPAVILLDLKLPRLNGIETLERIRADETTANIPVVMLTTSDSDCDMRAPTNPASTAMSASRSSFREFSKVTAKLGMYWLLLNRRPPAGGAAKG